MSKKDVAETFLEAVDIVVQKRLEGIKYDTTDVATIIDDKSAKNGRYIVSTGSVSYVAYSTDTTYRNGDCVYVTIPNGDYDGQKIISGKKVSSSEEPYVYVSPFETIIDVTGNLCNIDSTKGWSLTANLPPTPPNNNWSGFEEVFHSRVHIWDREFTAENLIGFSRLGIQAQFMSWLSSWKTIYGNYGLELTVDYKLNDSESILHTCNDVLNQLQRFNSTELSDNEKRSIWDWIVNCSLNLNSVMETRNGGVYTYAYNEVDANVILKVQNEIANIQKNVEGQIYLIFDCNRFQGDPYSFNTYYQQEMVFDLSFLGDTARIKRLSLDFYEEPSNPNLPLEGYPKKGFKGTNVAVKDYNELGEELPYGDIPYTQGDDIFFNLTTDNLFVKDIYICLGYDLSSFNQDTVKLYTISSQTFADIQGTSKSENDSLKKDLSLRWIHEFENDVFAEVYSSNTENLNYEIRWYRYKLGAKAPDNYAGVFWERIDAVGETQVFNRIVELDPELASEKFKVIILLFEERLTENNTYESLFVTKYESNVLEFTNERETINKATQIAIDGYSLVCIDQSDGNYFVYGQNQTIKDQTEPYQIRQLQCYYKEPGKGNIPQVVTKADYITWRFPASDTMLRLAESFSSDYTGMSSISKQTMDAATIVPGAANNFYLQEWPGADKITTWIMAPAFSIRRPGQEVSGSLASDSNTYLTKHPTSNENYNGQSNDSGVTIYQIQYSQMYYDSSTDEFVFAYKGDPSHNNFINSTLEYQILSHYYQDYQANTVTCEIQVDGKTYNVSKQFQFGPAGSNGSQYTVVIGFDDDYDDNDNKFILTSGAQEDIKITATILGPGGHAAELPTNPQFIWEWEDGTYLPGVEDININNKTWLDNNYSKIVLGQFHDNTSQWEHLNGQNHGPIITLHHNSENTLLDSLLYLKCTVVGVESYDLIAIAPIAVRSQKTYEKLKGPTIVAYRSDGSVEFLREPFKIQDKRDLESNHVFTDSEVSWEIYNPSNQYHTEVIEGFLGEITADGHFTPMQIYVDGAGQYGVRCKLGNTYIYNQPIYCCLNRYSSGAINNWNGKELIVDYDNGLIMANAISAGKKNPDNTFSGVIMGDWSGDALDTDSAVAGQTGIYGFNHGAMSYAFTEDGTGFIGKDGMGRILFDGNKSTIKSGAYQQDRGGMKIDLDDGIIHMKGSVKADNPQYNGYFEVATDVTSVNYASKRTGLYIRTKITGTNSDGEPYSYYEFSKVANNSSFSPTLQYYYYASSGNTVQKGTGGKVVQNIYTPTGSEVFISANEPIYLSVKTENPTYSTQEHPISTRGSEILRIGSDSYFLQSDDWVSSEEEAFYTKMTSGVNSSNFTNYYVIDSNSWNWELDSNATITANRNYFIKNGSNYTAVTLKQYQPNTYYTKYRLDTSVSYDDNKTYYTFNTTEGTFNEYTMIQNQYAPNQYYFRTNTGKVLCNDSIENFNPNQIYYTKNSDNTFSEINLISGGNYQANTYYYLNNDNYILDTNQSPTPGREYYSKNLIYEGYSSLAELNLNLGEPTYDIVGKYILTEDIELATGVFNQNTLYYEQNTNNGNYEIVDLIEPTHYPSYSETQYCTYNNTSGFYTVVQYENLRGGVVYYLREYQGLEQDGVTKIYSYTEVGKVYVLNYYYYLNGMDYVQVHSGDSYNPNINYYEFINGEYVLLSPNDVVIAPDNFTLWQNQGLLYTEIYVGSNLGWEWYPQIYFYDDNFELISNSTDFNNAEHYYIKNYIKNTSDWNPNITYYEKDSSKDVYNYVSIGEQYNNSYQPGVYYIDSSISNIENEEFYDTIISLTNNNFLNEINAVKNNTKKTYLQYISDLVNGINDNIPLSRIYNYENNNQNNTFSIYLLNSSGNPIKVYYNNYQQNIYYYLDTDINYNNRIYYLYNGNIFENSYTYYEMISNNPSVIKFYKPNNYYYKTSKYIQASGSFSNSITYYKKNESSGTKIDIASGNITSYNLDLIGYQITNTSGRKKIMFSSTVDQNPLRIGPDNDEKFTVNWDGHLIATSADIGGWRVTADAIYSKGYTTDPQGKYIILDSNGNIEANYNPGANNTTPTGWRITKEGDAFFNSGLIGGWSISDKWLAGDLNTTDWIASVWLFSKDQGTARTVNSANSRTTWRILAGSTGGTNYRFGVDKNGYLFAQEANISGTITATGGSIAGWTISGNRISKTGDNFYVALCAPTQSGTIGNGNADVLVIRSGTNSNNYSYPFVLSSDGSFTATKATIKGSISGSSISASSISGTYISGGTIEGAYVKAGTIEGASISGGSIWGASITGSTISGSNIYTNGTLTINGHYVGLSTAYDHWISSITYSSGSINWYQGSTAINIVTWW